MPGPRYRINDPVSAHERYFHHLEWPRDGWQYRTTSTNEAEHPNGWKPEPPDKGWRLNVDRWPLEGEAGAGYTRISPGVLRSPDGRLTAYWRRKR